MQKERSSPSSKIGVKVMKSPPRDRINVVANVLAGDDFNPGLGRNLKWLRLGRNEVTSCLGRVLQKLLLLGRNEVTSGLRCVLDQLFLLAGNKVISGLRRVLDQLMLLGRNDIIP
ncbi:hypothetical protein R1flu_009296 [Riccia fluitans]|uniref:Uncharacterized protein n=1 Tax=Riccia fluitans TaxID=41844 RepID=A0ABD1Z2U1_9MARC